MYATKPCPWSHFGGAWLVIKIYDYQNGSSFIQNNTPKMILGRRLHATKRGANEVCVEDVTPPPPE
jgi:hypothetical protein